LDEEREPMTAGTNMAAIVAARALRADRALVERLLQSGATTAARAAPLERLSRLQRRRLLHLERHGVVRMAARDRWFVDEEAWRGLRRARRWNALAAIALAVIMAFFLIYWVSR
jgi:hypothetical protein